MWLPKDAEAAVGSSCTEKQLVWGVAAVTQGSGCSVKAVATSNFAFDICQVVLY